jgi:hypothetical protein
MRIGIENKSMQDRLQHLFTLISGQSFLKKQGLGNEVPFFICPFKPEESIEMGRLQRNLVKKLEQASVQILEINLYDLSIEILNNRGIWKEILDKEESVSKERLKELLQNVLDPESHLIPAIVAKMENADFDVLFITGVGEVFPYIRSHNVLNNLQSTAKEKPTVMFFPGAYTHSLESGASLELFGKLHDDKYYRAFNIYHCQSK